MTWNAGASRPAGPSLRPVELPCELGWPQFDQAASLERVILAVTQPQPGDGPRGRIDDQDLVDLVGREERDLLQADCPPIQLGTSSRMEQCLGRTTEK